MKRDSHSLVKTAALPALVPPSGNMIPLLAILLAVLFWGGSFSAMKIVVSALGPWTVMWLRMTMGLLIILPFARRLKPKQFSRADLKLLIPLILLQPCCYFLLESNALTYTTSAQAGVISASVPLLVAVGAWLFLGERSGWTGVTGLCLSLLGVAWLSLAGSPSDSASNPLLGNLLEFGAMVSAAAYMILLKKLSIRYNPWTLTGLQTLAGVIFFLPGLFTFSWASFAALTTTEFFALLYLGSFVTLGAFGLYNWGISRIPANRASAYINLIPVVAVILGWTLLDEALNTGQIAGAACVFLGVWLSQYGARKKASHSAQT
ncbi:MAG: DMT family transporter [Desulfovibrionales bacterium]